MFDNISFTKVGSTHLAVKEGCIDKPLVDHKKRKIFSKKLKFVETSILTLLCFFNPI